MPIMSDQWITYQAQEKGLITPFVPRSMSTLEDGTRVSSYGLSSYGYDLRLNNSFKLFNFTNLPHELTTLQKYQVTYEHGLSEEIPNRYFFNSVIDPVNFDEDLSTLLTGVKTITVPPHGFLLAVSAEYIKLGRDFTGVCMEKSTLARCFSGDTKIALVDGTSPTFLEAIERVKSGEKLFGYSVDHQGSIVVAELVEPRKIGTEETIEIVLDNGTIVKCTPDHKFMTLKGDYIEAKDITTETSLMPLYRVKSRGYEAVYHKVIEVRRPADKATEDVYCLTAPEYGNFALEAGVFVKNCGLCVTVTPLEPEWEGYLTLEISNKTNLPIVLTAGMGICQLLFLQGNEPCLTSYKDRSGKYQNQPPQPVTAK